MKALLFFALCLNVLAANAYHPTHISIVNMELNSEQKVLDYSVRLFQEDVLYLLKTLIHEELHKGKTEKEAYSDTSLIPNYFIDRLKINADGKVLSPKLEKQTNEQTELWLYFTIRLDEIPEKLTIENSIYTDLFNNPENMLIFSYMEKELGLNFNSKNTKHSITPNKI